MGTRDYSVGDLPARKTLEIIDFLKPRFFSIENPDTSKIWKREFSDLATIRLDYCQYTIGLDTWGYRKRTRFHTNVAIVPRMCDGHCGNMIGVHHKKCAQHGTKRGYAKQWCSPYTLYRVPPILCREFLEACERAMIDI